VSYDNNHSCVGWKEVGGGRLALVSERLLDLLLRLLRLQSLRKPSASL
jgi:hypothetical protein